MHRDVLANIAEVARGLEKKIVDRQRVVGELERELTDLQQQIATYRRGHPLWPRALAVVVGAALAVLAVVLHWR